MAAEIVTSALPFIACELGAPWCGDSTGLDAGVQTVARVLASHLANATAASTFPQPRRSGLGQTLSVVESPSHARLLSNQVNHSDLPLNYSRCLALHCPAAYHSEKVLARSLVFLLFVIVAMVIQWVVLSRTRWKYRHLPYWVARLQWQPVTMFSKLASVTIVLTMAVVGLPFIMSVAFAAYLPTLVREYYVDMRSPVMVGVAAGSLSVSLLALVLATNQFRASRWKLTTSAKVWGTVSLTLLFMTFAAFYTIAYVGIPWHESGGSFAGIASVFLTLNLLPLIVIQFDNHGSGMPIDYAIFLKSTHKYDPNKFVVRVAGAGYYLADGVYKRSEDANSDGVAVYIHQDHPHIRLERRRFNGHYQGESFWAIVHVDGAVLPNGDAGEGDRMLYVTTRGHCCYPLRRTHCVMVVLVALPGTQCGRTWTALQVACGTLCVMENSLPIPTPRSSSRTCFCIILKSAPAPCVMPAHNGLCSPCFLLDVLLCVVWVSADR